MTDFGVSLDPFRPMDVLAPHGDPKAPPRCPGCESFLQHVAVQGDDQLFECMGDGYSAAWRAAAGEWQEPVGRLQPRQWSPPLGSGASADEAPAPKRRRYMGRGQAQVVA